MNTKSMYLTTFYYIATFTIALTIGYEFGSRVQRTSQPPVTVSNEENPLGKIEPSNEQKPVDDDDDEDEDVADGDLTTIAARPGQQCKLVLVVRTDLKMTTGKIAAQCGHATLACYQALAKKNPQLLSHWQYTGQAKIALKASSEEELLELEAIAKSLNLCARSIQDAGRTQIAAGSRTVLGIGPAPVELINQVTGHLRLL